MTKPTRKMRDIRGKIHDEYGKLCRVCGCVPVEPEPSRSVQRRVAVQQGEPMPTFEPQEPEMKQQVIPEAEKPTLKAPPTGIEHWYTFVHDDDPIFTGHGQCICGKAIADGVHPFKDIWEAHMREVYGAIPEAELQRVREALEFYAHENGFAWTGDGYEWRGANLDYRSDPRVRANEGLAILRTLEKKA